MEKPFGPLENPTSFRKMAAAIWHRPNDPSIYGSAEIDMTRPLELLTRVQREWGIKVTVTHLITRALAVAIARHPEMNVKVRFWGRLERRRTVDLFVQVASEGGRDLSGCRIGSADQRSLRSLAEVLLENARLIRADADPVFKKSRALIHRLPWWILRPFFALASILTNELHVDLAGSGMPVDPFGTAMVTSLGMFGVDEAYAPMTPVSRCMMILLVPEVKERVWVEGGQLSIRPTVKLCATFDHRVVDGVQAATLCRELRAILAEPETLL